MIFMTPLAICSIIITDEICHKEKFRSNFDPWFSGENISLNKNNLAQPNAADSMTTTSLKSILVVY